ncbi:MAG: hypothetical protein JST98_10955 [Bacteroidetes bacterium]|nr:hypothetical protein [Bacteroidota bacterium]
MKGRGIRWDRRVEVALVLAAAIAYGSWREFTFINLNYQIDHLAHHTPFSYAHSMVQGWLRGWGLQAVLALKWFLAFFSMAVMAALCALLARILLGTWRHAGPIFMAFTGFALLSLALHFMARRVPPFELVAVQLSHMLQYPVPLVFVLIAASLAQGKD